MPTALRLLFASLALCGPFEAQGSTLLVDGSGGGPLGSYLEIQHAVDAAASGDLVLVSAGTYGAVTIDGKQLYLAAQPGEFVQVLGGVTIQNLVVGEDVAVVGLDIGPETNLISVVTLVRVLACAGPVLFQDCRLLGTTFAGSGDGIRVVDSLAAAFVGVDVDLPATSNPEVAALRAIDSTVSLHDSSLASHASPIFRPDAGPGIHLQGGFCLLMNTSVQGGQGADAGMVPRGGGGTMCAPGSDGGPAVRMVAGTADPELVMVSSPLDSGAGGLPDGACPGGGAPGTAIELNAGTLSTPAVTGRSLEVTGVAPDKTTATFTFTGEPLDAVFHAYAFAAETSFAYIPLVTGIVYPGAGSVIEILGFTDNAGVLTRTLFVDDWGFPFLTGFQQALFYSTDGDFIASNPALTILLDDV